MPPPPTRNARASVAPVPARRGRVRAATGGTTTVTAATRLFHVRFQFRNPLTDALVEFPAGLRVLLLNGARIVGAAVTTDAHGYAALPFPPVPPARDGRVPVIANYHFIVRPEVLSYLNLADGALVRANNLARVETRDLFELPLDMDTSDGNFTHDPITGFTRGRFANYQGTGEGTASAPLMFTLNLFWYPLRFQYFNHVLRRMADVPRGMCVQARINNKTAPEAMVDLSFVGAMAAVTTLRGRQQRLKWLGFFEAPVDGIETAAYTAALRAFQGGHGLPVNGTADAATLVMMTEVFLTRRVSVMRDSTYLIPVIGRTPVHPAGHIDFQVKQENLWLSTAGATATPALVISTPAEITALTPADRFKFYDLPSFWTSEAAYFRRGSDLVIPLSWETLPATLSCYPAGTTPIPQDNPLIVNLDDMVLLRDATHLETITAGDRYSVFDLMGAIVEPDADQPYLSQARNHDANYFSCQDGGAFTVYLNGNYYFANRKRVPANLRRAGLRAAILNEQVNRAIQEPLVLFAGNLEENFFHGVDYRDSKIVSYVVVLWTCKLVRHASATTPVAQAAADQGIIDYKREGLTNCKQRHEEDDFEIVDKDDAAPQMAKVLKHFVAWDSPQAKCTVQVHNGGGAARDNMGIDRASFHAANWQARGGGWAVAAGRFTAAHELGHAVGLDDDYIEPPGAWGRDAWGAPVIPRFAQWVKGNPFAEDGDSLMNSNLRLRHRMVFHHVNWMNSNPAIRLLTGDLRFKVKTADHDYYLPPPDGRTFLTAATRHIHYTPVLDVPAFVNGTTGKMDLTLYKVGRDQTPREMVAGQDFDGVLVVSLYINWTFQDVDTTLWTTADKMNWIKAKYGSIATLANRTKYLGTAAASSAHFEKIYVMFRLHFHEGGNGNDNVVLLGAGNIAAHFTVTSLRTHVGTAAHAPSYHTAGFTGAALEVDESSHPIPWFRYMLGLSPATLAPGTPEVLPVAPTATQPGRAGTPAGPPVVTETTTLDNADLAFLSTWANTTLGAAGLGSGYTVRNF